MGHDIRRCRARRSANGDPPEGPRALPRQRVALAWRRLRPVFRREGGPVDDLSHRRWHPHRADRSAPREVLPRESRHAGLAGTVWRRRVDGSRSIRPPLRPVRHLGSAPGWQWRAHGDQRRGAEAAPRVPVPADRERRHGRRPGRSRGAVQRLGRSRRFRPPSPCTWRRPTTTRARAASTGFP